MSTAFIPCVDYFEEDITTVPGRIKRTNPDAIKDRWANFIYSMDLSALPGDEDLGNQDGAWSLWDIPSSHCAQIEDDRGNDVIVVAIVNMLYVLDWTRFRDEWAHNTFAPIYRMVRFGPVPYNKEGVEGRGGYALNLLKRFRELQFVLRDLPVNGPDSVWRISVGEDGREEQSWRIGVRNTIQLMRVMIAVRGRAFTVRLENSSNDPMEIESWYAGWDMLGHRLPAASRSR